MDSRYRVLPALPKRDASVSDGRVLLDAGLLKGLRKQHGLSQETLAEACLNRHLCVSIASIKRAETGKPVLYRTARHLATAFDVDVSALLGAAMSTMLVEIEQSVTQLHEKTLAQQTLKQADDAVIRYVLELSFAIGGLPDVLAHDIERLVRQFGGAVSVIAQDVIIARFGSPHAYRSDSERGLLCALALSREQFVKPGHALLLRLVRLGNEVAMPEGDAILLARQPLSDHHGHAPVYVAQSLLEQLASRFEFSPTDEAFPTYRKCRRLRNLDENAPRPLVGRAIELLQFKGVIEATHECQDGHVVYVRGMAGIGKTRLVSEFFDIARQSGFACHRADVLDFGMDNSLWPLGQLVGSLLGVAGTTSINAAQLEAGLSRLKVAPEHWMFLQVLTAVSSAEPPALYAAMSSPARTQGLLLALVEVLRRIAVQQPLLIGLEDLHWGDAPLFTLLGKLLDATDEAPIVWLLTSRPEGDPLENSIRAHANTPMSVLDIAPIRAREASALAAQFIDVDPHYRADCVIRAQGNPLYLTQLLASQEGTFPDSLRHLIQTRFDKLASHQRHALHYAAVLGNRFELTLWREALGQPDYLPTADMRQGLLREVEPGSYLFVHDLVMHCLYDAIPDVLREQLHRTVAKLYRERDRVLHAQHLLRAKDPAAFDALLAAMDEKRLACQYDSVLALAHQCAVFGERSQGSFTLALLCGQACSGLGQTAQAREHFQRALALAQQPQDRIEAALGLAAVLNTLDCLDEEERLIEDMLPVAQALRAHTALARLHQLHGNIYFPRGDYVECRRLHEEALSFARIGRDLETEAKALSGIGDSYYAQGNMQTAYEVFDQCVRLCERHGLVDVEAGNRSARGSAQFYLGQPHLALRDATDAIEYSRRIGNHRAEVFSRLTASWVLAASAQQASAEQQLTCALELARNLGASRFEAILLEGLARVALHQGERKQAQTLIMDAANLVERFDLHRYIGPWIYGSLAMMVDDPQLSDQALLKGETQLTQACLAHNTLRFRVAAAEACLLAGNIEQAIRHGQQMAVLPESASCAWVSHHVRLIDVASQWLRGDRTKEESLKGIQRAAQQMGFVATMPRLQPLLDVQ
ncbi:MULTISPECIES: tetratricopeptide repeat protein [unclassified Pseudomonas]|uniref:ATP-binding protein n=1 Tax=unclassified Pseudomonas TaxID=196821 RepID=UPI00119A6551|nr:MULTISPECIES: tetratricopeptide repeat protein [unclassified Pseudomonas]TWC22028.1 tetratricopeptide repeat protein [Pseudomonas sp. SJZ075]TWC22596.1 tetratricopeptide repeat protein [Pseudomonas sp. SJZ074]TWC37362.1 tetratricopeptide repeat protein [Pseudomonas sp. SJZ078]TWC39880.1 tetratricopeptide repeat protein [Pseudomonas sp. SJZ085]TWC58037.1 tetratricopeptide repeat protein [Pseudomonas sp. SJZ124]